jgi:hypothetical protein
MEPVSDLANLLGAVFGCSKHLKKNLSPTTIIYQLNQKSLFAYLQALTTILAS